MKVSAIIVAAGSGSRFGRPKQLAPLAGIPLFMHSVRAFALHPEIDEVVLVAAELHIETMKKYVDSESFASKVLFASGGERRQDSVANGLAASWLNDEAIYLVHDAARPLITGEIITNVTEACREHKAVITATPVVDTLKKSNGEMAVHTVSRSNLWMAQTPQAAQKKLLLKALAKANDDGYTATDEAELLERIRVQSYIVIGENDNFKVTYPKDILLAEQVLNIRKM